MILDHRPDVLFCSDYDDHIDHKALTLLFDKVMGQVLKENPGYVPAVYKTYAYGTAWMAEPDYYADNVSSTRSPFGDPCFQEPEVYCWGDRVRFSVDGNALSRSLIGSDSYRLLGLHESQHATLMAASVVNGDRVGWQRSTDSPVLHADVTVSSGNGELLNDFMLIENHALADESHKPYDGVWIPAAEDTEKMAAVTFKEPEDISAVVLYDHPSKEQNVLNAVITFDDGQTLQTGPLDPGGAATVIAVNKKNCSAVSVNLTETEGEGAGLSEIEVITDDPLQDGRFIKMMDQAGNFLYDCLTGPDGSAEMALYRHGGLPELTQEHYSVETAWGIGTAVLEDGVIRVHCPEGETLVVNVTCGSAGVSDSVCVRNPGRVERLWMGLWQDVEEAVFTRCSRADEKLLIFSIPKKLSHVLRHLG